MTKDKQLLIGDTVKSDFRPGQLANYCGRLPNGQHIIYYEETEQEDGFYTAVDNVSKREPDPEFYSSIVEIEKEIQRLINFANKYHHMSWKLTKY